MAIKIITVIGNLTINNIIFRSFSVRSSSPIVHTHTAKRLHDTNNHIHRSSPPPPPLRPAPAEWQMEGNNLIVTLQPDSYPVLLPLPLFKSIDSPPRLYYPHCPPPYTCPCCSSCASPSIAITLDGKWFSTRWVGGFGKNRSQIPLPGSLGHNINSMFC